MVKKDATQLAMAQTERVGACTTARVGSKTRMEGLLVTTIDNESPAGSWRREWDARSHTPQEYIEKIRELRLRNKEYLREIEDLKHVIENLKEELVVIDRLIYRSNRYETE